jgi:hypothetical protein
MPIVIDENSETYSVRWIEIISNQHFVLSARSETDAIKIQNDIKKITDQPDKSTLWDSPHRDHTGTQLTITGQCDGALLALLTLRVISLRTYRACLEAFESLAVEGKEEDLKTNLSPNSPNFY